MREFKHGAYGALYSFVLRKDILADPQTWSISERIKVWKILRREVPPFSPRNSWKKR